MSSSGHIGLWDSAAFIILPKKSYLPCNLQSEIILKFKCLWIKNVNFIRLVLGKVVDALGNCTLHSRSYLCGLSEDEFRVFDQTLQRHSHIDDLCSLVFPTVVRYKLPIPGVEDDETWF